MKNLTTRKIVFGMLLAFVLALGVQGTVDAQDTSVSGDSAVTSSTKGTSIISVATISEANPLERSFTLRVTKAEDRETVTITPTGVTVTEIEVTSAPSDPASDPDDSGDPEPSPAKDMIVTSPISFDGLGNRNDNKEGSVGDPNTGSWTFKVTYTVANLGPYSIEVTGNDNTPDIEAYVVQSKSKANSYEIDKTTAANITPTPQETRTPMEVRVTDETGTTGQSWVQVDLSISNGKLDPTGLYLSGSRIYEQNDASNSGYTRLSVFTEDDTIGTIGDISVNVRPDRDRTATVTAQISGVSGDHASHTVTYFDEPVQVERVSGNYQHARTGDRLPEPLVVRVSDGTRLVRDQRVRFTATATGGRLYSTSSSLFIRESGTSPSE
jgi:hypothetical protein